MAQQERHVGFIYGTAWKRERTTACTASAIKAGFVCFDTANQPRHYREDLVGEAIREALAKGLVPGREAFHIQTKFSRPTAQDPETCPYDLSKDLEDQVRESVASSLWNLRPDVDNDESSYIDCILLHSPYPEFADTLRAWRVLESFVPHKIRALGISNAHTHTIEQLCEVATVKPSAVQLRFHPDKGYEVKTRQFCAERGIMFQAHRILKGNDLQGSEVVGKAAGMLGLSKQATLYLLVLKGLDGTMRVVNGTTSEEHMAEDLAALRRFDEVIGLGDAQIKEWESYAKEFRPLVGDN
ncbi:Aldo/keto reductase [Thozetella sp. PMI_491]|nr:Aldo/keto reductase [Thozetella sp. PMI_491]